jgi:hypothetical protein
MLKIITAFFVFSLILFLYLHIQFHLKTSNNLEIYEIDQASKDKMEEICDLRQPVLFDSDEDGVKIINTTNKNTLLENYPVFELKIRDNKTDNSEAQISVPLQFHMANKLFEQDKQSIYFSEGNLDFLQETGAVKNMSYNDEFLRPYLVSNCYYDILLGSNNVETPFRYELNYRNYFIVTQGSIQIKLAPPKSERYLYPIQDYENFEFKSAINPWQPQSKFKADFDKIKCLEIVLTPGKFLFIPAYWWYSFKFSNDTSVSCFKYRTYMNNIAISPQIFMYALQNQNVERKIAKQIDISFLQTENNSTNKENNIKHENNMFKEESKEEYNGIPEILIPNDNNQSSNFLDELSIGQTLINNDNIEIIEKEIQINV